MKKQASTLMALFLAAASSIASPVQPGQKKTLPTADGTVITAERFGDEFVCWWQTADGSKYVLSADGTTFHPADFDDMQRVAKIKRASVGSSIGNDHITYTGNRKGLIILVEFADTKFKAEHDVAYYKNITNTPGFTNSEGYVGSVADYYSAQSNGLFNLSFDVVGPVVMPKGYAYYGANTESKNDVNIGEMLRTAADAIAPEVNLADYDWDGDGTADQVFFLYAGLGEAASDDPNTIWPHMHYMRYRGGVLTYPTGKIDRYACAAELLGVLNGEGKYTGDTRTLGIGTICHEFSHCLGFPDMYDTNGQHLYGMGFFDLLANGNYLANGLVPPNFTAWERIYAGWVEPIVLDKSATVQSMQSSSDYGRPFIMYNDNNPDEYYLFENRQKTGWDRKLYGKGLMITHVDYDKWRWTANRVNATGQDHQRCTIFHADNSDKMTSPAEIRGDLYPYYTTKDGVTTIVNNSLTDESTPAATLWNSHDKSLGITYMSKPVTEITQNEDGTISFLVMGGNDENVLNNAIATGISAVSNNTAHTRDQRVYSIDGTLLGNDINALPRGIYIVGGKKIVK